MSSGSSHLPTPQGAAETMDSVPRRRILSKGDACTACNLRKIRCSGDRPVCAKCQKRSRECIYPNDVLRRQHSARTHAQGTSSSQSSYITPFDELDFGNLSTADNPSTSAFPFDPPTTSMTSTPSTAFPPPVTSADTDYLAQLLHLNPFLPTINLDVQEDQPVPIQWDDVEFQWDMPVNKDTASTVEGPDETQQQHLLWLYFSNQRLLGLEFYISRFYERLDNPNPALRPHPSLLNAIYLAACKLSPIEQIRNMEISFYEKARAGIDQSFKEGQANPGVWLDLARSSRIVAVWLWTQSREAEAVMMTSLCSRYAVACSIEQIPSAFFTPQKVEPQVRRVRHAICGPPQDQIDLLERIYTFWSIFILDAVAAISSNFPSNLDPDTIKTPLPWSWSAVEIKLDRSKHVEERLEDLYDLSTPMPHDPDLSTDLSHLLKALYLLHKACFLRFRFREAITQQELGQVIKRFTDQLPVHLRTASPAPNTPKTLDSGTATLHFIITSAQVLLYDTNSYSGTNDQALYYARRFVGLIRLLGESNVGDLAIAVYSYWQNIARTLIRESKRLQRMGDELGASIVDADIDVILDHLRDRWDKSALALMLAARIDQLREGPPSEVDEEERLEVDDLNVGN